MKTWPGGDTTMSMIINMLFGSIPFVNKRNNCWTANKSEKICSSIVLVCTEGP